MTATARTTTRPELLAPAGDWDALRAAVANGADAVYFGLSDFNARFRAANFQLTELPRVLEFLHARNVRGYVTLNTLIFSDELAEAARFVCAIAEAGTDAVIVQDLGLARLIRRLAPSLPIHASTQMTLTDARGCEWVRRTLGVDRVILARELSVAEIGRVRAGTAVPVEVFVHGALCVAYSGQCLTSEALGGRSANRGQCAQACRLPYTLLADGQPRHLGDRAYLLSPQDLSAPDLLAELTRMGVSCFKIEGRLKSPHYVAATTQVYRAALDAALAGREFVLSDQQRTAVEQCFSRGLTHGFLDGVNHQVLVAGRYPKSRGVRVGIVVGHSERGVLIRPELRGFADLAELIKPGDGVVFDQGHPEQDEPGGRVFEVHPLDDGRAWSDGQAGTVELVFGHGNVLTSAVNSGAIVWKTDDPVLRRRLEQSFAAARPARRVPVSLRVWAAVGDRLRVELCDDAGRVGRAEWDRPLEPARQHPLSLDTLTEQFCRLGETPYQLASVVTVPSPPEPVMVPKSVLNELRRRAVEALSERRRQSARHAVVEPAALQAMRAEIPRQHLLHADQPAGSLAQPATPSLYVLARTLEQVSSVCGWQPPAGLSRPAMVYADFDDVRKYPLAVAIARAAGQPIGLATLRILKPGEEGLLRQLAAAGPDAVLVRNLTGLDFFRVHFPDLPLVGDFSLNVANELTADLLTRQGLRRVVPSYDLNWVQLTALLRRFDPTAFEAVIHQHMPMFHMEHCVFAAFLSTGKDHHDCGRPCDRHRVDLSDRVGVAHPVMADVGCRNTVFNGTAQSAAEFVPRMRGLGLCHFRVELLRETAAEALALLGRYASVLAGRQDGHSTWKELRLLNQLGVTRGTLQSA